MLNLVQHLVLYISEILKSKILNQVQDLVQDDRFTKFQIFLPIFKYFLNSQKPFPRKKNSVLYLK
jgi:hypothetical protein